MQTLKSYLGELDALKILFCDKICILSTVNVTNLYKSLSILLVTKALHEALKLWSSFSESIITYVVKLCELAPQINKNSKKNTTNKRTV